jgi:hypothetical protein
MIAMHELVVPKSMPKIFPMIASPSVAASPLPAAALAATLRWQVDDVTKTSAYKQRPCQISKGA